MPVVATAAVSPAATIVFAARREIVQAIPAGPASTPVRTAASRMPARAIPRAFAKGDYVVQLGAFENAGVARAAWGRLSRLVPALSGQTPRGMSASVGATHYYRLAVGGYSLGHARSLCGTVRAKGGNCFVRTALGEQTAQWVRGPLFASR
jgi:cell division septation protein DedD